MQYSVSLLFWVVFCMCFSFVDSLFVIGVGVLFCFVCVFLQIFCKLLWLNR